MVAEVASQITLEGYILLLTLFTLVCDANTKKDGSKATKRDLSDWSSAKSKGA